MSLEFVVASAKNAYVDLVMRRDWIDAEIARLTKQRDEIQKQIDEASVGLDDLYAVTKIDLGKEISPREDATLLDEPAEVKGKV